jgi:hypothetical protein
MSSRVASTSIASIVCATIGAIAPAASASSSMYWYGEGGSTCWQTGQPGSPSQQCDSVGPEFLAAAGPNAGGLAHFVEGGVFPQTQISASGDYCGDYRTGDALVYRDEIDESAFTGFQTPRPFFAYQVGDAYRNICQAFASHWGQELRNASPGSKCVETCGMNHYVSFHDQGVRDRPWSSALKEPSLVVSGETNPYVYVHGASSGAWGYLCPLLEDTTTHNQIEYCLQEWISSANAPEWHQEGIPKPVGNCASVQANNSAYSLDLIHGNIGSGTSFSTQNPGSASTSEPEVTGPGWKYFSVTITEANLLNAVKTVEGVCKRTLSHTPGAYALIGVEQGNEGWRELKYLGGSTANLQLSTNYAASPTPLLADVNGDGKADAVADVNGNWYVAPSSGHGFGPYTPWIENFGKASAGTAITPLLADVNGDGKADAVADVNGNWYVAPSSGHGFGPYTPWIENFGKASAGTAITPLLADVNGDGKADALVDVNGNWYVALSNGSGFGPYTVWIENFGKLAGSPISAFAADVNGDGKADAIVDINGSWYVAPSTGSGFGAYAAWIENFGKPSGAPVTALVADVNGDRMADAMVDVNGTWYVAPSNGHGFGQYGSWISNFGSWSATAAVTPLVADVTGDGEADAIVDTAGNWYVAPSSGGGFGGYGPWIENFGK